MSDHYELTLSVRLPASLGEGELDALRRHFEPEGDAPALLESAGRLTGTPDGWLLTAHRTVHPEEFGPLGALLAELAELTGIQGPVVLGQLRSPDSEVAEPLLTRQGAVVWPA